MAEIVVMPQAGNSVESCIVLSWRVSEGDAVSVGDILCEIETDKATMEVESTAGGTVLKLYATEGDEVPVKDPLVAVGDPGETAPGTGGSGGAAASTASESTAAAAEPAVAEKTDASVVRSFSTGQVRVSPRARKRAAALGVDPAQLSGSGPGGRVIERDVVAAAEAGGAAARDGAQRNAPRSTSVSTFTDIAVAGIRKTIAGRMHASLRDSAQLTLHRKADARALLAYRKKVKDTGTLQISINDMVNFAVTRTLGTYPEMNAHFLDSVIRRFDGVDLGFAVDTPRGLLVPTIRGAGKMTLAALAGETRGLAERAVAGTATPDDLGPATFTVTNLGGLGIEHFTPVLNTPQVGILGVGTIVHGFDADGEVIPQIGLSLTIDHRGVDGAPAARFLQELADNIANFELTLAL
jgi:pyruvate dehydrogenase E2 component (dihydrolipoamide acetyltransferase)